MRRTWIIVSAVVIGLILALSYAPRYDWVGGYDLTVHIDSPNDPPAAVGCIGVRHRYQADDLCARSPEPAAFGSDGESVAANPYDGKPLILYIWTCGTDSVLGRRLHWDQKDHFLVVSAEWRDGRRACKVVEIPDGRESREVRVSLP